MLINFLLNLWTISLGICNIMSSILIYRRSCDMTNVDNDTGLQIDARVLDFIY